MVVALSTGQLANRVWLFAHFIAASIELQVRLANPAFGPVGALFKGPQHDVLARYPQVRSRLPRTDRSAKAAAYAATLSGSILHRIDRRGRVVQVVRLPWNPSFDLGDTYDLTSDAAASSIRNRRVTMFKGWQFAVHPDLAKYHHELRTYFEPIDSVQSEIRACLATVTPELPLVGLHIRRGDYTTFLGGRYHYSTAQYGQLIADLRALFSPRGVQILACSNDEAVFKDLGGDILQGPGTAVADLYALSSCDYVIGPPSTFSMWASFYGQTPLYSVEDPSRPFSLEDFVVRQSQFPFELSAPREE